MKKSALLPILLTVASASVLAACTPPATSAEPSTTTAPGFPRDVENCGRTVHLDAPPQRIVSGWPTSTEVLLRLDLADRVAGHFNTSNAAGAPSEDLADAYAAVTELNPASITREQLVAADPDLLWADGTYLFDGQQLPTIDELEASGVPVIVLSGFCTDDATGARVEDVLTDLQLIGEVTGEEAAARTLAQQATERLDAVTTSTAGREPLDVAMLSVIEGSVYAYDGIYSDMAEHVGARNVFAGQLPAGQYFSEVSREFVVQQDPDAVVYLSYSADDAAQAEGAVLGAFPGLPAVVDGHVLVLPAADSTNLRVVDGVENLAAGLGTLGS